MSDYKLMRVLLFTSLVVVLLLGCEQASEHQVDEQSYNWKLIDGLPKPQVPVDNPMTPAKVELGRYLFYDKNLSANQSQSCASCHQQALAFSEPLSTSVGSTGQQHRRNAQALVNVAYNKTLTWAHDGITELERQILLPLFGENPIEMDVTNNEAKVLARFNTAKYQALFSAAFPERYSNGKNEKEQGASFDLIVKALASFVRSLISLDSDFDRYAYYSDDSALSESAIRGMQLFFSERLECHHCHGGFNFTQSTSHQQQLIDRRPFHNTGLYNIANQGYPKKDIGLAEISSLAQDNGRFRAPTLRNVEVSAPYMHDGSIATLEEVLDFYAAGGRHIADGVFQGDGRKHPLKSQFVRGFEMSEQEKSDLLAFLTSLTDHRFLTNPDHSAPQDY